MSTARESTALERAMPVYHFHERHSRWINATPDAVWQALSTLTLDQLSVTRPLFAVRYLGRPRLSSGHTLFTDGPVRMFDADLDAPRYALGGSVIRPWRLRPARREIASLAELVAFTEPGWAKCLTDFDLCPRDGGVQLTTETRGYSTDDRSRRRFAAYWALIRPASGLIRRDMLATVARQAERGANRHVDPPPPPPPAR